MRVLAVGPVAALHVGQELAEMVVAVVGVVDVVVGVDAVVVVDVAVGADVVVAAVKMLTNEVQGYANTL
jgi:hypothetical protein